MGKDLKGKELGKGISQRKDGKYQARFIDRFGARQTIYGKSVKEVKNNLAKAKAEDQLKQNVASPSTTLDEWYAKWMDVYKRPVLRESSIRFYEHIYKSKIQPTLGKHKISDITKLQVTALLNDLKSKGYKWETLNKTKILLIDIFNRALEDDFVTKNPAKGVRIPINKSKNSYKVLTREEQNDFLEFAAGHFYYNLFIVAINTGLRPGEIFALTEKDLDFKKKVIHVNKTLLYEKFEGDEKKEFHIGDTKTYCSVRDVPMNEICRNALLKQIMQKNIVDNKIRFVPTKEKRREEFKDLLFTTKFGTPLNSELLCEAINKMLIEMNETRDSIEQIEKFSGHSFRHTFATRCFEAGIPPKTVQGYLGHATLAMTMDLYTSLMDEKKQDDMKLLEENIGIKAPDISKYSKIVQFYA